LHRFSEWKAAGFCKKSLSFTTKKKYRFMTQKSLTFDECKQLSSRLIAMNPNRRANMGQISSHLLDYYTELTKQPWLAQLVGQIRDLTAQQRKRKKSRRKKQKPRLHNPKLSPTTSVTSGNAQPKTPSAGMNF
jgi:predicted NAD-dependent protein-ADP-ribosyltransferase YbiA (DUF1768 family)